MFSGLQEHIAAKLMTPFQTMPEATLAVACRTCVFAPGGPAKVAFEMF